MIGWKSQTNQNGGLTLCWICFNSGTDKERKEIQVDDFSEFDISQTSHSVSGFPALFGVFTLRTDPQNILNNEGDARNNSIIPLSEVACVASGISRASAFVLVATPWTRVVTPWEEWWRIYFTRGFAARKFPRGRSPRGSMAAPPPLARNSLAGKAREVVWRLRRR